MFPNIFVFSIRKNPILVKKKTNMANISKKLGSTKFVKLSFSNSVCPLSYLKCPLSRTSLPYSLPGKPLALPAGAGLSAQEPPMWHPHPVQAHHWFCLRHHFGV